MSGGTLTNETPPGRGPAPEPATKEFQMNTRIRMLATVATVVATTSIATAQDGRRERQDQDRTREGQQDRDQQRQRRAARIGEKAPNFTLNDAAGKEYKLSDQAGKIVILQWINPDCPVCKRVASTGLTAGMLADTKAMSPDIVVWAINSTKDTEPQKSADYLKSHKLEVPGLSDKNGSVGRRFGARTTPHVFVIDQKGVLRYSGAFDDDPSGNKGSDSTNYVVNAVGQIVAGDTVAPDTTRPYGCSVKYAAASPEGRPQRERGGQGRGDREDRMKAFDLDGDGELSAEERQAMFEAMWEEMPDRMKERILERYDADGDGEINGEELEKMNADRRNRGGRGGRRGGGGGGGTGNDDN